MGWTDTGVRHKVQLRQKNNCFEFTQVLVILWIASTGCKDKWDSILTNPFLSITVCLLPFVSYLTEMFYSKRLSWIVLTTTDKIFPTTDCLSIFMKTLTGPLITPSIFTLGSHLLLVMSPPLKYTQFLLSFPNFPFTLLTPHHWKNSNLSIFLSITTRTEYIILGLAILF